MPRFIIHIGPHKTGSTYLQLSFRGLRQKLAARGVLFPDFWELAPGNPSQLPLTQQLRAGDMDKLAPRFAELRASGAQQILLSSEDLSNAEAPMLERLRELLQGDPVQFVFYARRWSELLPSSWQEHIKQGHRQTLPEFMLRHMTEAQTSRIVNFEVKLAEFAAAFGPDSLRLVAYSELRDRKIDMFRHFAKNFLDWPDAPSRAGTGPANVSGDPRQVEALRLFNVLCHGEEAPLTKALLTAFKRNWRKVELPVLFAAMDRNMARLPFNDDAPGLKGMHAALARKYLDRTVPPHHDARLFKPAHAKLAYVSTDYLAEDGVAAELNAVLRQLKSDAQPSAA